MSNLNECEVVVREKVGKSRSDIYAGGRKWLWPQVAMTTQCWVETDGISQDAGLCLLGCRSVGSTERLRLNFSKELRRSDGLDRRINKRLHTCKILMGGR